MNSSPERLKLYDFSEPLLTSEFAIFTSGRRPGITSFFDLRGLKVGVEKMGLPDHLLRQDPGIKVQEVHDLLQCFRMLVAGELDAVVADHRVGSYVLAENHIKGVKLTEEPISRSDSALAVKKGNSGLLEEINSALADIRRDGTYDRIVRSWQTKEIVFKTVEQIRQENLLIMAILAALMLALLAIALFIREIRRRNLGEAKLRESEERLRLFIEHAPAALAMFDREMHYLSCSRRWMSDYGLGERDLRRLSHYEVFPEIGENWKEVHRRGLAGEVLQAEEERFERGDASVQWLRWEVRPWHDGEGGVGGIVIFTEDITERKLAQEALALSLERLRLTHEAARAGTWEWDLATNENSWSDELWRLYGLELHSCEPSYETWRRTVHPHDLDEAEETVQKAARLGTPFVAEWRVIYGDGTEHWLMSHGAPLHDAHGRLTRYLGIVIDISDRKQAEQKIRESEERLRVSLAEKEVLLKEIHHRVKNNMQVISSLVSLQAEDLSDDSMRDVLRDVTHRVRSMALVHEKLYQSPDLARIDFAEYTRGLLNYLLRAHGNAASEVRLGLDLEPVSLPVNAAVSCGLILNELVSNALKHAFRDCTSGEVAVSLHAGMQGQVRLCVQDNGPGLPEGYDWKESRSLGLRLVEMLAGQLHASVEVSSHKGAKFAITFVTSKE